MNISDAGLDLIKRFEGYHDRLPDGSCRAYLCPAKVVTIGFGCTEGVKMGDVWTAEQAEAALRREIAKHEAAVVRLVTVELNQNERDALISFSYNVGSGALSRSTLLKKLNAGDRKGAAGQFKLWNKGGGRVLRGLVDRRAREATLFMTPVDEPDTPAMPQKVEPSPEPFTARAKATAAALASTAATTVATTGIPAPPEITTQSIGNTGQWLSLGNSFAGLLTVSNLLPLILAAGLFGVLCIWLPRRFA
jgi:GH24 family phage-related lysozyme (muramidase)